MDVFSLLLGACPLIACVGPSHFSLAWPARLQRASSVWYRPVEMVTTSWCAFLCSLQQRSSGDAEVDEKTLEEVD